MADLDTTSHALIADDARVPRWRCPSTARRLPCTPTIAITQAAVVTINGGQMGDRIQQAVGQGVGNAPAEKDNADSGFSS
jgi:hypothetical protein